MVSANEDPPGIGTTSTEPEIDNCHTYGYAEEPQEKARTYVGTREQPHTYTPSDSVTKARRPVAISRVTDDFGERIEVRFGEALILGPLIESVLQELRAKAANED